MTAATVRARHDGSGSSPAADDRMAGDLEVPRPLRLLLTAGWNLSESVGLPVAAYVAAAWLDGRNAGLIAGLAAIWLTAVIRKVATGSETRSGCLSNYSSEHTPRPQGRRRSADFPSA